jgi:hypothetical protein
LSNPAQHIVMRDTTSAAYYEALGYTAGDQLQKKLEKNRRALGRDDSGLS